VRRVAERAVKVMVGRSLLSMDVIVGDSRSASIRFLTPSGSYSVRIRGCRRRPRGKDEEVCGFVPGQLSPRKSRCSPRITIGSSPTRAVHHYVTAGPELSLGLPHGFPQAWLQLHPVIERVRPPFRMIAPDLPGIGGNPGPGGGYDEHSLASDVTAILPAEEGTYLAFNTYRVDALRLRRGATVRSTSTRPPTPNRAPCARRSRCTGRYPGTAN
jgi:hypothetical protein